MIANILELVEKEKRNGYNDANATAKVCQDIVLESLAIGPLNRNVTIKGGVVMRSKTKNVRRATQDLDIDFIRYSLADESIELFIEKLNWIPNIKITRIGNIEELRQQDYRGKRIYIQIQDFDGNVINSKIDIGVHNRLEIEQEEYCFDVTVNNGGVSLLINSNEQIFSEKLCSLLKFGPASTRYKDVFDIYYLIDEIDKNKLEICLESYIFQDKGVRENDITSIIKRVEMTFDNKLYQKRIRSSDKKWVDEDINDIFVKIINYLVSLEKMKV